VLGLGKGEIKYGMFREASRLYLFMGNRENKVEVRNEPKVGMFVGRSVGNLKFERNYLATCFSPSSRPSCLMKRGFHTKEGRLLLLGDCTEGFLGVKLGPLRNTPPT
jgi:hypothetical protein